MCVHTLSLCTTIVHNTAQNSSGNFPSYLPDIIAQMMSAGWSFSFRAPYIFTWNDTRILDTTFCVDLHVKTRKPSLEVEPTTLAIFFCEFSTDCYLFTVSSSDLLLRRGALTGFLNFIFTWTMNLDLRPWQSNLTSIKSRWSSVPNI